MNADPEPPDDRDERRAQAIERLLEGRSVLVIAHRLSTVRNCDWRLHFEDGRVEVRRANQPQDELLPNEALA